MEIEKGLRKLNSLPLSKLTQQPREVFMALLVSTELGGRTQLQLTPQYSLFYTLREVEVKDGDVEGIRSF